MLQITIPATELWDERKKEFVYTQECTLEMEHSLASLSKWESKWCKPFLTEKSKTAEETLDYIRCMTLTPGIPPETYEYIPNEVIDKIVEYINAPMTATWFKEDKSKRRGTGEAITAELVYYWMTVLNIPNDYENWHLNKLFTFIKVCSIKNAPSKKMSQKETASQYAALNAARRKALNSKG